MTGTGRAAWLIRGDARALPLADRSVQCVVTSPPYWGLRDYGRKTQIGLEPTPADYIASLVAVFREVWRVLRDDGTVWLNLGDSYAGSGPSGATYQSTTTKRRASLTREGSFAISKTLGARGLSYAEKKPIAPPGFKSKDLMLIPARVALALQADGWYLRADVIWSKPNPMPESVRDRPTRAHEHLFLLTKFERYAYDAAAIAEPLATPRHAPGNVRASDWRARRGASASKGISGHLAEPDRVWGRSGTRNRRSVWTIATQPYRGAHFATMPEKLVMPCILAGCRPGGVVLDPFVGSGTVVAVAQRLGRRGVGVDLRYQGLARERCRT